MINDQRVRLMTKLSVYENNEGLADERVNSYFLNDYISLQILRSFICATLAFILILAVYTACNFEGLVNMFYTAGLMQFLRRTVLYYIVFLLLYIGITIPVYLIRFRRMEKHMAMYSRDLKALSDSYRREKDS